MVLAFDDEVFQLCLMPGFDIAQLGQGFRVLADDLADFLGAGGGRVQTQGLGDQAEHGDRTRAGGAPIRLPMKGAFWAILAFSFSIPWRPAQFLQALIIAAPYYSGIQFAGFRRMARLSDKPMPNCGYAMLDN
jgi:hypothetical protein